MMDTQLCPETEPAAYSSARSWVDRFRDIQPYLDGLPSSCTAGFSIAGNAVSLEFGSERFRDKVSPAFRHLEALHSREGALRILLHDLGSAPRAGEFLRTLALPGGGADIWLLDEPDLMMIAQRQGQLVTVVDWRLNTAYWLVGNADSIPYIERAAPLRLLLSYWLGARECFLIHAALVGNEHGGVLLIGPNGAGKSTTALACLDAGLGYAADDHCLVSANGSAQGHSIFGTGKLGFPEIGRFPSILPAAELEDRPEEEKVVFFLDRARTNCVSRSFQLRAILLAHISGSPQTSLREMTTAESFRAIAPSCALHFPSARPRALRCFNSLVRQLPAYVLELGSNVSAVPAVIRDLLARQHLTKGIEYGIETR